MMILWIGLILCTSVIVYAGTRLSKYGDIIAEKTGLGGTWIGVVLLASVTSLPELVTGISSVTYAGVPDIAIGNVIGACVSNLHRVQKLCRPGCLRYVKHKGQEG